MYAYVYDAYADIGDEPLLSDSVGSYCEDDDQQPVDSNISYYWANEDADDHTVILDDKTHETFLNLQSMYYKQDDNLEHYLQELGGDEYIPHEDETDQDFKPLKKPLNVNRGYGYGEDDLDLNANKKRRSPRDSANGYEYDAVDEISASETSVSSASALSRSQTSGQFRPSKPAPIIDFSKSFLWNERRYYRNGLKLT